jgi:pimeloyl-ACP methyl ester carboxylesterase
VIGVDLQAHGHTADIDRPLRFETMADDVAALIRYLGVEKTAVAGYSLGGMWRGARRSSTRGSEAGGLAGADAEDQRAAGQGL